MFYCASIATVWPEILAGRYYWWNAEICHLVEFTWRLSQSYSHKDIHIHNKMAN